jgi:hypothetical protein
MKRFCSQAVVFLNEGSKESNRKFGTSHIPIFLVRLEIRKAIYEGLEVVLWNVLPIIWVLFHSGRVTLLPQPDDSLVYLQQ